MSHICDADLQFLKPGKRVVLKSYKGDLDAPHDIEDDDNYWLLIGSKAVVVELKNSDQALIKFERDLSSLGLIDQHESNCLWVLISDLKFVCRY